MADKREPSGPQQQPLTPEQIAARKREIFDTALPQLEQLLADNINQLAAGLEKESINLQDAVAAQVLLGELEEVRLVARQQEQQAVSLLSQLEQGNTEATDALLSDITLRTEAALDRLKKAQRTLEARAQELAQQPSDAAPADQPQVGGVDLGHDVSADLRAAVAGDFGLDIPGAPAPRADAGGAQAAAHERPPAQPAPERYENRPEHGPAVPEQPEGSLVEIDEAINRLRGESFGLFAGERARSRALIERIRESAGLTNGRLDTDRFHVALDDVATRENVVRLLGTIVTANSREYHDEILEDFDVRLHEALVLIARSKGFTGLNDEQILENAGIQVFTHTPGYRAVAETWYIRKAVLYLLQNYLGRYRGNATELRGIIGTPAGDTGALSERVGRYIDGSMGEQNNWPLTLERAVALLAWSEEALGEYRGTTTDREDVGYIPDFIGSVAVQSSRRRKGQGRRAAVERVQEFEAFLSLVNEFDGEVSNIARKGLLFKDKDKSKDILPRLRGFSEAVHAVLAPGSVSASQLCEQTFSQRRLLKQTFASAFDAILESQFLEKPGLRLIKGLIPAEWVGRVVDEIDRETNLVRNRGAEIDEVLLGLVQCQFDVVTRYAKRTGKPNMREEMVVPTIYRQGRIEVDKEVADEYGKMAKLEDVSISIDSPGGLQSILHNWKERGKESFPWFIGFVDRFLIVSDPEYTDDQGKDLTALSMLAAATLHDMRSIAKRYDEAMRDAPRNENTPLRLQDMAAWWRQWRVEQAGNPEFKAFFEKLSYEKGLTMEQYVDVLDTIVADIVRMREGMKAEMKKVASFRSLMSGENITGLPPSLLLTTYILNNPSKMNSVLDLWKDYGVTSEMLSGYIGKTMTTLVSVGVVWGLSYGIEVVGKWGWKSGKFLGVRLVFGGMALVGNMLNPSTIFNTAINLPRYVINKFKSRKLLGAQSIADREMRSVAEKERRRRQLVELAAGLPQAPALPGPERHEE